MKDILCIYYSRTGNTKKAMEEIAEALDAEIPFSKLVSLPVREQIGRFKYVQESEADSRYDAIVKEMDAQIRSLNGGEQEYA